MDAGANSAFSDFNTGPLIHSTQAHSPIRKYYTRIREEVRALTVHAYVEWGTMGAHAGGSAAE